ncbi:MAG: lamin tail domain-containing protein [Bacteroidota bacterium]
MRIIVFSLAILYSLNLAAQFTDNFSDGDFTTNPNWTGDTDNFIIENEALRSAGPEESSTLHLSTRSDAIENAEWSFLVRLDFPPSTSNQVRIYLVSDQVNLEAPLNGYFVELGQSGDDQIKIFRQDGANSVLLFTGNSLFSGNVNTRIRVQRTEDGIWSVATSDPDNNSFQSEGDSFKDEIHKISEYFGVLCKHTTTRNDLFFFDDFEVSGTRVVDRAPPTIESVSALSATEIKVTFSEDLDTSSAAQTSNYRLDQDVDILGASAINPREVVLTTTELANGGNYLLQVEKVTDLAGNEIEEGTAIDFSFLLLSQANFEDIVINEFLSDPIDANDDFIELYNRSDKFIDLQNWTISDESSTSSPLPSLILRPDSFLIIYDEDAAFNYSDAGTAVTVPNLTLNNDNDLIELKDQANKRIAFLEYGNISQEAISLELVNPEEPCISFRSYQFSTDPDGNTAGRPNSVLDNTQDSTLPTIISSDFDEFLEIQFSEVMDADQLSNVENYSVSNLEISSVVRRTSFPDKVTIEFQTPLTRGTQYKMSIQNLSDCAGNVISDTSIVFGVGRDPDFNEVFITEILFDESPVVGLPEREYIEIFNATSDLISTEKLVLTDASNSVTFPASTLTPGSYTVLTSSNSTDQFEKPILGISGFPGLNNSGELLTISFNDTLVTSLEYDPAWHDPEKSDGGHSLEMVDISNPCLESPANWRSSLDPSGGTPGRANSISESLPDSFAPTVEMITVLSGDSIRIDFNEKIQPSATNTGVFEFSPKLEIEKVHFEVSTPNSLFLSVGSEIIPNEPYSLNLFGITDCAGNTSDLEGLELIRPITAEANEIKLSEVLFNPRSNGVDFVEIFNDSENYLSLKGWKLAREEVGIVDDIRVISAEELVIEPKTYFAISTDPTALIGNYPRANTDKLIAMTTFPRYNNDKGTVLLLNAKDEVIERFYYEESYHYSLLNDVKGVSLERLSFTQNTNSRENWRSAASTEGFATPGYLNSQSIEVGGTQGKVAIAPKTFIPGNAGNGRDFTRIEYQFSDPGKFANIYIYDRLGRLVRTIAQGTSLSTSGFFRWDGVTDSGAMARMGYHLVLFEVYDSSGKKEIIKNTVVVGRQF